MLRDYKRLLNLLETVSNDVDKLDVIRAVWNMSNCLESKVPAVLASRLRNLMLGHRIP